jgi:hypothetical protein
VADRRHRDPAGLPASGGYVIDTIDDHSQYLQYLLAAVAAVSPRVEAV